MPLFALLSLQVVLAEPRNITLVIQNNASVDVQSARFGASPPRDYGPVRAGGTITTTFEANPGSECAASVEATATYANAADVNTVSGSGTVDLCNATRVTVSIDGAAPEPPGTGPDGIVTLPTVSSVTVSSD